MTQHARRLIVGLVLPACMAGTAAGQARLGDESHFGRPCLQCSGQSK